MNNPWRIADILQVPVQYSRDSLKGKGKKVLDLGPLQLEMPIKILASHRLAQTDIILCQLTGDLGLFLRYNYQDEGKLILSLLDLSREKGSFKGYFRGCISTSDALKAVKPLVVRTFAPKEGRWQEA